ncbi:hypothetical protein JST97_22810 [bacterium]|nr:hypothetical protein [bacterium]
MSQLLNYHRSLFQWHCRKFFRFRRHLSEAEKAYLEVCFALAQDFQEVSEAGYEHFSYYSYSHRVEGERVNSSRLAYGSVLHPAEALQAALPVLSERAVVLDDYFLQACQSKFYGLGWDILEEQFKVYFRVQPVRQLPASLAHLLAGYDLNEHREEGLVSFTFTQNKLSESKVYLYPKSSLNLPAGAQSQASMVSDRRGLVRQFDLSQPEQWVHRLSPPGQKILQLYGELDEELDTIQWQDNQNYTLYFP